MGQRIAVGQRRSSARDRHRRGRRRHSRRPERDSLRNLLYFWCSEEAVIDAERGSLPRLDAFRPQTPETHAAAPSPPADASAPAAGGGIGATWQAWQSPCCGQ